LRVKPDYAEVHYTLGIALGQVGRFAEAIGHFERVLQIQPGFPDVHYNLGLVLVRMGRVKEGIGHCEQALRLKPDYAAAEDNLAWLLATLPPADGGDPVQALTLAQRACELTDNRMVPYLDTLAVAYAAAGQFTNAVTTCQRAVDLGQSSGQTNLLQELNRHLELFRNGRAYRVPASAPSPRN
jgi:tetratricopeptide (TPR) repeat protein